MWPEEPLMAECMVPVYQACFNSRMVKTIPGASHNAGQNIEHGQLEHCLLRLGSVIQLISYCHLAVQF